MSTSIFKVGLSIFILNHLLFTTQGQRDKSPTVAQYGLEAVDFFDRSNWRFFLPDDTDIDQDGNLSDAEVEHKFMGYLGELFKIMDQTKDNIITKEELVGLQLNIPKLNKIIDIALENYPLKPVLLAADRNGDGLYDERDFNTTGAVREIDPDLEELVDWRYNSDLWEKYGRLLFLADTNQDEKITLEEIASKAKSYLGGILGFVDQNGHTRGGGNGHLSVEDFTSLNMKKGKIHEIFDLIFNDIADRNTGEIDLYNLKIGGQDLSRYTDITYQLDNNGDQKLNSVDFYWRLSRYTELEKVRFLIPMLMQKLDKDQDGKIKRQELRLFTEEIFEQVTLNDAITLQDIYALMRKNDFDCFQVGALRTYINMITNELEITFENLMTYIFKQLDIDGNGQITIEEFQKMHLPCAVSVRDLYSNAEKMTCHNMAENLVFGPMEVVVRFPDLEMRQRRRDDRISIVDKLANAACEIMR